jgi:hypothetical protein
MEWKKKTFRERIERGWLGVYFVSFSIGNIGAVFGRGRNEA